jgi:hypothetical protein
LCNFDRDNLASPSVELVVPPGEQWTRACCELSAPVQPCSEPLVEFVKRHRDKITKCLSFELDQPSLGYLMVDMQTMKSSVLRQTPINQESPNQYLLLPTC